MLEIYKNRELKVGQRVKVYFNLRKKLFSVRDFETNLVVAHGDHIQLNGPIEFLVNQKGRELVVKTGHKNVHAFVVGNLVGTGELDSIVKNQFDKISYNPYTQDKFTVGDTNVDANRRDFYQVVLSGKNVYAR